MFIYQLTNIIDNKIYIGKTSQTLDERFAKHAYNSRYHNTYLYRAIRKHGIDNFYISPIEQVVPLHIDERERYWIDRLEPEYNLTAGGTGGDTSASPNYKRAIKKVDRSNRALYASYGMLGKKTSEQTKRKIGEKNSCPVMCEGVQYPSVGAAEKSYGMKNIRRRLDNPRYPDFYRLKPKIHR